MIPPVSKREAARVGLDTYFTGKPCSRGHVFARWVLSGECIRCERESRVQGPPKGPKRSSRWLSGHPEYEVARKRRDQVHAEHPTARDPSVTTKDFVGLYAEARRLTKDTGVTHVVAPVVPYSAGGTFTPDNLRAVPRTKRPGPSGTP